MCVCVCVLCLCVYVYDNTCLYHIQAVHTLLGGGGDNGVGKSLGAATKVIWEACVSEQVYFIFRSVRFFLFVTRAHTHAIE